MPTSEGCTISMGWRLLSMFPLSTIGPHCYNPSSLITMPTC